MKYRIPLIGAGLALAALALWHPAPHSEAPQTAALTVEPSESPGLKRDIKRRAPVLASSVVYVVGAVRRPGLYHIAERARADDAVRAAGGLRADADPAGVNLAAYARDGDEIDVPMLGQSISRMAKRRTSSPRTRKTRVPHLVDLNDADASQLATLPGIGATIAARIVAVREHDGAFTSLDELLDVAGMTQSRLDRAENYLRI